MRRITVPQERIYGLKLSVWKDITYASICVLITVLVGTQAAQQGIHIVSPIPQAEAQAIFTPLIPQTVNPSRWETFKKEAQALAPIYNFPVKVIVTQAALESNRGQSEFAIDRNNYFGIGAYDWSPNDAYSYDNPEQCIIDYMLTVRRNFPEAYDARSNPDQMITLLESNSQGMQWATDPDYTAKLRSLPEWEEN